MPDILSGEGECGGLEINRFSFGFCLIRPAA